MTRFYCVKEQSTGISLTEAVVIDGQPLFVQMINGSSDVVFYQEIELPDMILLPPNILECHPDSCYEFESQEELRKNIVYANQNEILLCFIDMSRNFTLRPILLILATHTVLLTLYTITSCFQGKFAKGHQIYNIDDNGFSNNSIYHYNVFLAWIWVFM